MTQYETMLNRHLQEILKLGEDTYRLSYTDTVAISQWWFTQKLNESNAKTAVVGKMVNPVPLMRLEVDEVVTQK
eukprot:UN02402